MKSIRIGNGLFTESFVAQHKGQKVMFYPEELGQQSKDHTSLYDAVIPGKYEWEYTPIATAVVDLNGDNLEIATGEDCDYILLSGEGFQVYFGKSLSGWLEYKF